ncbi:MAG TPA: hypothetical protein VML19_30875 [Verrucomicrobiae bacterium]|nr:hypothetical protein [Verrucomicrobiae bacterium]
MSIAAAFAADNKTFKAPAAADLAHKQTNEKLTIAVDPYVSGDKVKAAFGKLNPYEHGVLPVLVVIQNDTGKTIQLKSIRVEYVGPHGDRAVATPPNEVKYATPPKQPTQVGGITLHSKNPLDVWEIEGRAFQALMLPAGSTASGFFYFQTGIQQGATLYLSGLTEAGSNRELMYFEVPLN